MRSTLLLSFIFLFSLTSYAQQGGTEDPSKRSMFSQTFAFADGHFETVISATPIHYQQNDQWLPIQTQLTLSGNEYSNTSNLIRSHFPSQINGQSIRLEIAEKSIYVSAQKELVHYQASSGLQTLSATAGSANAVVNNHQITYKNVYASIDDHFEIHAGMVKNELILRQQPASLANVSTGYYGFSEQLSLPAGWTITGPSGQQSGWINGELLIRDANNEVQLRLPAPFFFDAQGPATDGSQIAAGGYFLQLNNGQYQLATLASVSWLKDAARQYPIHLDPTLIIPGNDGGWQSPVNVVNNPAYVFVGLCCGNETHRAWLNFTTTGVPSTACINSVELQLNCVAVGGTALETVFVNDITGGPGPYPGVNPTAYADFGTGTYTSFTATTTGTYGYYNLGATAAADMQAMLPSGFFELGFHLQDEFSTDWKRFNTSGSSLRVDHGPAGSCSLLGVEVADFDATCGNNQQEISWTIGNETPLSGYELQQSTDGIHFSTIAEVPVDLAGSGTYQTSYEDPQSVTTYYRLQLNGLNGEQSYSSIISNECLLDEEQITIYPNPVSTQHQLHLDFYRNQAGTLDIQILNALGQVVQETTMEFAAGSNQEIINLHKLHPGNYQIILKDQERQITRKFIKQ